MKINNEELADLYEILRQAHRAWIAAATKRSLLDDASPAAIRITQEEEQDAEVQFLRVQKLFIAAINKKFPDFSLID